MDFVGRGGRGNRKGSSRDNVSVNHCDPFDHRLSPDSGLHTWPRTKLTSIKRTSSA
jgi:hypothetical protein